MSMLTVRIHFFSFSSFIYLYYLQEGLLYHWLAQMLLLVVCLVKNGLSHNNPCYFYPKHGVIHSWYPQEHFSQATHYDKHHGNYQYNYNYQWNNNGKRSVLMKRSDLHAKYCQNTGQHHHEGGKHHILVYNFHVSKFKDILSNHFEKREQRLCN